MTQDLHQQPRRIAARAGAGGERLLGRLHARLHADQIADRALELPIEVDQKIDRVARLARDRSDELFQARTGRLRRDKGGKIFVQLGGEFERPALGIGLDEKVERIDHLDVGREVYGNGEFAGLFRENVARQPIAVRVLQPVHEMLRRRHGQRIARNSRAAMRRRPQPHGLRSQPDRPVVAVTGGVVEPDKDRHAATRHARICHENRPFPCNFRAAVNWPCRSGRAASDALCPPPTGSASGNPGWLSGRANA